MATDIIADTGQNKIGSDNPSAGSSSSGTGEGDKEVRVLRETLRVLGLTLDASCEAE